MERLEKNIVRFIVLVSLVQSALNFNFDTNFTIFYENPGETGELFGYSVILYEGDKDIGPWVQVGSPKGKTGDLNLETGNVYRCGIKGLCQPLSMPIEAAITGAALGNSMDISPNGKLFATCGHRWIQATFRDYYAKGFCHWGKTNENKTEQKVPFQDKKTTSDRAGKHIYYFGQGQAGFSAQFANIQETSQIIIGAPGVLNWGGLTFLWKEEGSGPTAARRIKRSTEALTEFLIPNEAPTNDLNLFGYSVTSGKYYDTRKLYYAAGAPRANMIGEVTIFEFSEDDQPRIVKHQTLKGLEYGEYYGGSLASANLNGDGFVDLIVGAPTYKVSKYDEGRIYVYYGSPNHLKDNAVEIVIIPGKQAGGQFGDTVASLGDIDFDGCEDIAVAATYEDDGAGAVYIYRGSPDGIITVAAQVIKAKSFQTLIPNAQIQGFGHSIARSRDIDNNRYNDLAIGAYKSEHVLVIRARPVIVLHHELQKEKIVIKVDEKDFSFTSCVHFTTNKEFDNTNIVVIPEFNIDQRHKRASMTEKPKKIHLSTPGVKVCDTYNVVLKDKIENRYEVIKYTLNLKLEEDKIAPSVIRVKRDSVIGSDNFCSTCAVLDPKERHEWEDRLAGFHLGCGKDDICNANLHVKHSFKGIDNGVFIIGSEQFLKLVTEVTNSGERAFLTELSIELPSNPKITLRSVPPTCREKGDTLITCSVADPLEENGKKTIELELDMDKINAGSNAELVFNISVLTSSENEAPSSNTYTLYAKKMANIKITGRSKEEYYQFDNTSSVVEFAQILQIQKQGPSAIDNVEIELMLPRAVKDSFFLEMYQPTLAPKGQLISCGGINFIEKTKLPNNFADNNAISDVDKTRRRRSAEDVTAIFQHFTGFYVNCTQKLIDDLKCESLRCDTGIVNKDVVEIQFKFRMNISNIPQDILGESDVLIIGNEFNAVIKDNALSSSAATKLSLQSVLVGPNVEKTVPIWIIIVAVLGGIVVLAIIAGVLYKLGFFKRTQKEKLLKEMEADHEATEAMNTEGKTDEE